MDEIKNGKLVNRRIPELALKTGWGATKSTQHEGGGSEFAGKVVLLGSSRSIGSDTLPSVAQMG
jgi:hypothetical protein